MCLRWIPPMVSGGSKPGTDALFDVNQGANRRSGVEWGHGYALFRLSGTWNRH
jgi:hypothetical protein